MLLEQLLETNTWETVIQLNNLATFAYKLGLKLNETLAAWPSGFTKTQTKRNRAITFPIATNLFRWKISEPAEPVPDIKSYFRKRSSILG